MDGEQQREKRMRQKMLRQRYGPTWKSTFGKDDSEPVAQDHRLRRLLNRPSPTQSGACFRYEQLQQLVLTGTVIVWKIPNKRVSSDSVGHA